MNFTISNIQQGIGVNNKNTDKSLNPQGRFRERTAFSVPINRQTSKEPTRLPQQSPPDTEHAVGFRTIKTKLVDKHTENPPASPKNTNKNKVNDNWIEMQTFSLAP